MEIDENEKSLDFMFDTKHMSAVNKLSVNEYFVYKENFLENAVIEVVIF